VVTDLAAIAAEFGDDPDAPAQASAILHTGALWRWKSPNSDAPAAWFFITIDGEAATAIRSRSVTRRGFGSVKVSARIGATVFQTSVFPAKEVSGFLLPVKAAVRKAERIAEGDIVTVRIVMGQS
jgi:hypothetical protein